MQPNNSCGCTPTLDYKHVNMMPLAMAYVPTQSFGSTYCMKTGLMLGTIFPELCKPFCGKGGACL